MPGKDEVGLGGQDGKAQALQLSHGPGPGLPDGGAAGVEVRRVLHGGGARGHGQPVHVVGVEAVLHPVQVRDQVRAAQGVAHPAAGQGPALGHGLGHQKVVVPVDHGHAALSAKVHIRLVHDDHSVRVRLQQTLDVRPGHGHAGGGVGVGDDDGAGEVHVVVHVQGEVLPQGDHFHIQAEQSGLGLVEPVGDVRVGHGPPLPAEGPEGEGQHLVGPVARQDVLGLQLIAAGDGLGERGAGGVGIQVQLQDLRPVDGLEDPGGRGEGALVGVELDVLLILGLLAGGVGGKALRLLGDPAAHGVTLLSLPCGSGRSGRGRGGPPARRSPRSGARPGPAPPGCSR